MPSQTKENYLKTIYFLHLEGEEIMVSEVAKRMEVSSSTVTNMIKKLKAQDWLTQEKYKAIELTEKGRKTAANIVRKHRLTEMFLTQNMGFGWEEVHDIAEQMEHVQGQALFDRMDEMLGHPTKDPHGSPIPDKNGDIVLKHYVPLSSLHAGACARLSSVSDSSQELLLYLNKKEIRLGTVFMVEEVQAFDSSMQVCYDERWENLSKKVCDHLMVEPM